MKPLIVLLSVFVLSLFVNKVLRKDFRIGFSARIALASMMLFSAMGHFAFTEGMSMMLPAYIPYRVELIYLTGLAELLLAIGLLVPKFQVVTAWLLIVFFILVLPANINASLVNLNIEDATYSGNGLRYLWFRIPLQLLFIAWTYLSAIKSA